MTLEEEWESCVKKFNVLAALMARKKAGELCPPDSLENHHWLGRQCIAGGKLCNEDWWARHGFDKQHWNTPGFSVSECSLCGAGKMSDYFNEKRILLSKEQLDRVLRAY